MAVVKITNLVKVYTLMLLRKRPMHGYELIKSLESILLKEVSPSHIYPFLKLLQKHKLIVLTAEGNRERKEYGLTAKGNKFSQDLINRFAQLVELSISPTITICTHCGCKLAEAGYKKKQLSFCCKRCCDAYLTSVQQ
jgi:DNA-binding PadR family transcriptional regulator